jgi:hypothetical protein
MKQNSENNILATGGLFAALDVSRAHMPGLTSIDRGADCAPNQLDVRFSFLRSTYRITVELLPGTTSEDINEDIKALSEQIQRETR